MLSFSEPVGPELFCFNLLLSPFIPPGGAAQERELVLQSGTQLVNPPVVSPPFPVCDTRKHGQFAGEVFGEI